MPQESQSFQDEREGNNNMSMNRLFKCKIGKELVVTLVTLALMWLGYYADNNLFGENILFALGSMLLVVIGLCIVFRCFGLQR